MAETNITGANIILDKLNTEIMWMTNAIQNVPDGLRSQLQTMIDIRKATKDALEVEMLSATIAIPVEAEQYLKEK